MATSDRRAFRFTYLRLENWRNFRQIEVELGRKVFRVGPNAAGKSNLLDALRSEKIRKSGEIPGSEFLGKC